MRNHHTQEIKIPRLALRVTGIHVFQRLKVTFFRWFFRRLHRRAWAGQGREGIASAECPIHTDRGAIPARLYGDSAHRLIIYFHGGGWAVGDLDTHDAFCRHLAAETAAQVLSVDYRLAPEHPFPAGIEDCLAATRWVLARRDELACPEAAIFLAGDSAGGNLAAVVAQQLAPESPGAIAGQVLIYPATRDYQPPTDSYIRYGHGQNLTKSMMEWFWGIYLQGSGLNRDGRFRHSLATPLYASVPETLPPALLITAEFDPLSDEGADYARRLQASGIPCEYRHYSGVQHGFACSEGPTREHREALRAIVAWMDGLKPAQ